jgi:sortase B
MKNGSMFAALKNYKSQDYWAAAPCIYLTDGADVWIYDIFAAYEVPTSGATYQLSFAGDDEKQAFLNDALARSALDTGITPTVQDRIVTLSTCTGSGHATRWVVQGVLRSGE